MLANRLVNRLVKRFTRFNYIFSLLIVKVNFRRTVI